ncbi:hypothetical protein SDC9_76502 [bioreactor metagenome]|uniref:Uncharacterized protein n=1 Tax=bioreactor metagenome TaxID=1076179 RepID=A0A644YNE1_9ZZZZ
MGPVDVLVFVHQDPRKAVPLPFPQIRFRIQQTEGKQKQIVKVDGVLPSQCFVIGGEDIAVDALEQGGTPPRREAVVLYRGYAVEHGRRLELLRVDVQSFHDFLDQGTAVTPVENGEAFL